MRRWMVLAALLAGPFLATAAKAQTEVRFDSLDQRDGKPVTLTAHWFVATNASAAAPSVVLLHGCGGLHDRQGRLDRRMRDYSALLNEHGVHALVVDSLTPRGERELCTQRIGTREVTMANRRRDALAALQWLATQPQVDAARLGLMGWSNGGSAVLAATNQVHREVARAPVQAAFAIAFYPGCEADLKRGYEARAPLLMLVGEADDWTPAAPCHALAEQAGGVKPEIEGYAGAFHGFDSTSALRHRPDVPNGAHPGQGVTVGGNALALARSRVRLVAFLDAHGRQAQAAR